VPEDRGHRVDPSDEWRHVPEAGPLWNESYYFDFVADRGALAGYVRIGFYPNLGVTWWTTMVVGPDRPLVASVAYDLPHPAGPDLSVGSRGYQVNGTMEEPLAVMRVAGTAPAAVHVDPTAIYRQEVGTPTSLALDLTWLTDGHPYHYQVTTRYEIPCLVTGDITLGGDRLPVDGPGQRDHSWGVRDWWAFGWCWAAARLDDGTRLHFADIRMPGQSVALGYIQQPDGTVLSLDALTMSEDLGHDGLPVGAVAHLQPGGIEVAIHPLAFGPLLLIAPDERTSRFPRAAARFVTGDGREGVGWIEWNQPDQRDDPPDEVSVRR
jgi:hypothetical protein